MSIEYSWLKVFDIYILFIIYRVKKLDVDKLLIEF